MTKPDVTSALAAELGVSVDDLRGALRGLVDSRRLMREDDWPPAVDFSFALPRGAPAHLETFEEFSEWASRSFLPQRERLRPALASDAALEFPALEVRDCEKDSRTTD